jgi:hypothetical protein
MTRMGIGVTAWRMKMMMEITKMKMMEIAKNNHMLSSMNRLFETTQVSQILCVVKMPPPLRSQVAKNAKTAGLNTIEFDEMRCIRQANQGQYQRTRWLRATAAKKNIKARPGNKEAQHTAAVNSIVVSETAETMCQNVDDMPSTPLRDIILRKRTYSQQASSDGDILQQTSDFEPNEESEDDIFKRASCFEPSDFEPSEESGKDVSASELSMCGLRYVQHNG